MLAKVLSATVIGLDGVLIEVEVDVAGRGFPTFTLVGLPDKAVGEAKDRVRTAIVNAQFEMPDSRITVNLAPADIPKQGSSFDLPIAVGILAASGMLERGELAESLFIGELSLEGNIRKVPGIISILMMARKQHIKNVFLPAENIAEAALIDGLTIYPVTSLLDVVLHLNQQKMLSAYIPQELSYDQEGKYEFDFADVKGQEAAKRALEIAAAGMHNIHLRGVPGAGKTMLSRAFPSILPPMTREEILEVSQIYSVVGQFNSSTFMYYRPFRAPHHTTSRIGLIGGGTNPVPGEISMAHRGVLFLDEFPEFPRAVLESMRQPLEDGHVTISRASGSITFPSRFLLLAASNPCPCGYFGHPKKQCGCMPGAIEKYKKRLSGPLLDRIDLHIDVTPVDEEKLTQGEQGESSKEIKSRVMAAYERQQERFKDTRIKSNGEMNSSQVRQYCRMTDDAMLLLKHAVAKLSLSARSYFKIIKISQTIADLSSEEYISKQAIAEALQYRVMEE